VIAVVAGRLALPIGCLRGIPAARPQGLGATVAGVVPRTAAAGMLLAVAGVSLALIGPRGLLAVGCAVLAAAVLLGRSVQRFGGITGDVLGACVEAATTAAALALSLHR
jgi:adenosylcobinamide-GDP ribazoletransferase